MSKQTEKIEPIETKIPILKKDAKVSVDLGYSEAGALAQCIFLITSSWKTNSPEKIEDLKKALQERTPITGLEENAFLIIDNMYKKILKQAIETNQVEYRELENAFNPLG